MKKTDKGNFSFGALTILLISATLFAEMTYAREVSQTILPEEVVTRANNNKSLELNITEIFGGDTTFEDSIYAANFDIPGELSNSKSAHVFASFKRPTLPNGHILKSATLYVKRTARQQKGNSQSTLAIANILEPLKISEGIDLLSFDSAYNLFHIQGQDRELSNNFPGNASFDNDRIAIDIKHIVQDWVKGKADLNGLRISIANFGGQALAFSRKAEDFYLDIKSSDKHSCKNCNQRPNIILLMTDDQGWADAGFTQEVYNSEDGSYSPFLLGGEHPVASYSGPLTPNLDELAHQGLIFNNFHSGAPVCSPTRGSALTGRNNFRLGIRDASDGRLETSETTLAEALKHAGYRTGHFGKWHLGTMSHTIKDSNRGGASDKGQLHYSPPYLHGYDVSFSTEAKVPTYDPMKKGGSKKSPDSYFKSKNSTERHKDYYGTAYWEHNKIQGIEHRRHPKLSELNSDDSAIVMSKTLEFIETSQADKEPFLAVVWFHTPHLPISHKKDDFAANGYKKAIQDMDSQVGLLHEKLQDLGISENTMIWFASDNGPEQGTKGSSGLLNGRKRSLLDGGTRVPGFLYWPDKISEGYRSNIQASTLDYYPTILKQLGIKLPGQKSLDGESLLKVINYAAKPRSSHNNPDAKRRRSAMPFAYLYKNTTYKYGLIYKGCKLLVDGKPNKLNDYRLYNLNENPMEKKSEAKANTCHSWKQDISKNELKSKLINWLTAVNEEGSGKQYPLPN
ncbi:MAG: sulfatase-like hydrolase/transferase [Cellvibrionaceae bacterium]|nr:sulfatase-like hydrolase/transferase [Cellvibrionaceae bacterium]